MKRYTSGYSRILIILIILFIVEITVLFFQFKDPGTIDLQLMVGITGLTLMLIGYYIARFRGRDWKGGRDYQ